MAEPKGKVFRLVWGVEALPYTEHRTRLPALFTEDEWGWSRDVDDSYVFDIYGPAFGGANIERSATDHAAALKAAGDDHAYPSVYGADAETERRLKERGVRHENAVAVAEASVEEIKLPVETSARGGWSGSIKGRVERARGQRRKSPISPVEVFAREEKRHLA